MRGGGELIFEKRLDSGIEIVSLFKYIINRFNTNTIEIIFNRVRGHIYICIYMPAYIYTYRYVFMKILSAYNNRGECSCASSSGHIIKYRRGGLGGCTVKFYRLLLVGNVIF